MYRIFCESYRSFIKDFEGIASNEYRYEMSRPLKLITDPELYRKEKAVGSFMFKQISDLLYFMACNKEKYPKFKAFLWTLESREIKGAYYGVTDMLTLEEQAKLVDMFLNLAYWKEIE